MTLAFAATALMAVVISFLLQAMIASPGAAALLALIVAGMALCDDASDVAALIAVLHIARFVLYTVVLGTGGGGRFRLESDIAAGSADAGEPHGAGA